MSTTIRPELSKKNEYWISKHRYYELKHFCMQYPEWKKELTELDGYKKESKPIDTTAEGVKESSTEVQALKRLVCSKNIDLVDRAADLTDSELDIGKKVLFGVVHNLPYDKLKTRLSIPCSKDAYYEHYRKFFYILSELRK